MKNSSNEYILEVAWGVPSSQFPENGIFQFDQAKALNQKGKKTIYLAMDMRSLRKWRKWGVHCYLKDGVIVYEYNVAYGPFFVLLKYYLQKLMFIRAMKRIERDNGIPKCIHVHNSQQATAIVDFCCNNDIPYFLTEHSRPDFEGRFMERRKKVAYEKAEAVVAVGNRLSDEIKKKYGVCPVIIPNIVDASFFTPIREKHACFTFITAANLVPGKAIDVAIRAFSRVILMGYDCRLTIMGDGPERPALLELSKKLGCLDRICFKGRYKREEFARELRRSDCFVLPSRSETFGIVYIEAIAAGVPVIGTKCGGPEDFVNETNGLLVDIDDVDMLSQAMVVMISRAKEYRYKEISEKCIKTFSSGEFAEKFVSLISKSEERNI